MKTVQTHFSDEFKTKAKLFKQIFLLQIELEQHMEGFSGYHQELKDLMESIERLLPLLMEDSTEVDQILRKP